ncbi:M48 family metallopeptidase [Pleionea sediminis]|uniref:M48 family metallopeptidase n=1 Tax=Pleionea sediminis TaxID=2569479 RepID=UPI001186CEC1|nr:M48 family metallopeptidase [Pleionea sediminis]
MSFTYPEGPQSVPSDLTKPTSSYRKHAWLAVMGLLVFVAVYFALAGWFSWSAYQIIYETVQGLREPLLGYLVGGCSAFLGLFMIKALFFIKHSGEINHLEVTQESEPQLFDFLHKLADEAGAPRPHRVYLSNTVNACVFYDLSILNFFFSSKKNLEIGLPLINSLSLGELKAVLAHEFGHFAQKSMSVGRWVYIAQQIAGHIIAKRDFLDSILKGISNIDLRVAWIGWIMRLIVWSIRSLMDSLFSVVVIAQRALTREMEFQADLVAVSITGSDALVHALHKLQAADDAWHRTLDFANSEIAAGRSIKNLFKVQSKVAQKMRVILDDPTYGSVEDIPCDSPENHRVFKDQLGQPPKMWATHPENKEREENAKRIYIAAPINNDASWVVFKDAEKLQCDATEHMLANLEVKQHDLEETLKNLDSYYGARFLNPNYKGAYLGRQLTRHVNDVNELFDLSKIKDLDKTIKSIYTSQLRNDLKRLRNAHEELSCLIGLKEGFLKAEGGVIRHNGKEYKRKELSDVIDNQRKIVNELENNVHMNDKKCRSAHIKAAESMGGDWSAYLKGLLHVLHYAEHSVAEVNDVRGLLNNVVAVALADGQVSSRELKKLISTGTEVCQVLRNVYFEASHLQLDNSLLKRLSINSWAEAMGEFTLPNPDRNNINDWMQAIDNWLDAAVAALSALRTETLEQLLTTESYIGHKYQQTENIPMNYGISSVPSEYTRLLPGNERKLQTKLGLWDRFHTADGVLGALLRFTVAGGIVGGVLWYSFMLLWLKV